MRTRFFSFTAPAGPVVAGGGSLLLITGLVLLGLVGPLAVEPANAQTGAIKIVVNASNPVTSAPREEVARIFLKKKTTFGDGRPAVPVDLDDSSAVRRTFSKDILGKDIGAVLTYWQEMIFSGRATPPEQRSSEADVLAFVRGNANRIGYVSANTDIGSGVRVLTVK